MPPNVKILRVSDFGNSKIVRVVRSRRHFRGQRLTAADYWLPGEIEKRADYIKKVTPPTRRFEPTGWRRSFRVKKLGARAEIERKTNNREEQTKRPGKIARVRPTKFEKNNVTRTNDRRGGVLRCWPNNKRAVQTYVR